MTGEEDEDDEEGEEEDEDEGNSADDMRMFRNSGEGDLMLAEDDMIEHDQASAVESARMRCLRRVVVEALASRCGTGGNSCCGISGSIVVVLVVVVLSGCDGSSSSVVLLVVIAATTIVVAVVIVVAAAVVVVVAVPFAVQLNTLPVLTVLMGRHVFCLTPLVIPTVYNRHACCCCCCRRCCLWCCFWRCCCIFCSSAVSTASTQRWAMSYRGVIGMGRGGTAALSPTATRSSAKSTTGRLSWPTPTSRKCTSEITLPVIHSRSTVVSTCSAALFLMFRPSNRQTVCYPQRAKEKHEPGDLF